MFCSKTTMHGLAKKKINCGLRTLHYSRDNFYLHTYFSNFTYIYFQKFLTKKLNFYSKMKNKKLKYTTNLNSFFQFSVLKKIMRAF